MSKLSNSIRRLQDGFCSAVVVAAGSSRRMGQDKLLLPVGGRPMLALSLLALEQSPEIREIILVTTPEHVEAAEKLRLGYRLSKLHRVVFGGATRTESAWRGVMAVSPKAKLIAIHDAARPFVTERVIADAVRCAAQNLACAPAIPVKDTLKRARGGVVEETPERDTLFAIQTPQVFRAELIKAALQQAMDTGTVYTDDCAAVEAIGGVVHLSDGDEQNIKLTTPQDLLLAEAIWRSREEGSKA
ncbi:MAG: 2-C-methyl-D-erythritol 4-phosphate cytidylyltransferase [Oscillospiraceae bacterium]|nr:2-C-methyl-D-erythritol 4-phosphate cytidylyltransferase [Oscillospiraceae bacterium]